MFLLLCYCISEPAANIWSELQ